MVTLGIPAKTVALIVIVEETISATWQVVRTKKEENDNFKQKDFKVSNIIRRAEALLGISLSFLTLRWLKFESDSIFNFH